MFVGTLEKPTQKGNFASGWKESDTLQEYESTGSSSTAKVQSTPTTHKHGPAHGGKHTFHSKDFSM